MTTVDLRTETSSHEESPVSDVALWTSVLVGPLVFLLNLEVNYAMVEWACDAHHRWALHAVHAVSLLIILAGAALGAVLWQRSGRRWPDAEGGAVPRARLLAVVGTLGSLLFAVSLVAHWIPVWVLGPCPRL